MDMIYTLICGLFMVSLSLYAKPVTTVQYKSTKTLPVENRSTRQVRNGTEDARVLNKSRAAKEPRELDTSAKGSRQRPSSDDHSNARKKPPKNREKRKNCFGFKMDRISDVSGMGCKSD
ncbi:hypothetical protein ABG768_013275 [Culter alburnus]|uniref:Uncharacterized protein n=1 Tax=Culter alburnus TaxID=194366 RepID=A0AAW2B4C3_CULAL